MAYEGETMRECPPDPYNFSDTFAVVVSGDGPNFCGHLILNVGGPEAPTFMSQGSERNRSSCRSKDTAAI